MSKKTPLTVADLGLTPEEQELLVSGARHLFGNEDSTKSEEEPETVKSLLADIALESSKEARKYEHTKEA